MSPQFRKLKKKSLKFVSNDGGRQKELKLVKKP